MRASSDDARTGYATENVVPVSPEEASAVIDLLTDVVDDLVALEGECE